MQERGRILSIDILRGLVMVIMALDHTRDYFNVNAISGLDPLDLTTTTPLIFFTRWITHFCAPIFVLLSGLSAFLVVDRTPHKGAAALFLLRRGLWLIVAELTIVSIGWSFSLAWPFTMFQVIWAIGMSMILLAAVVKLPLRLICVVGVAIIVGHNALDGITTQPEWPVWLQVGWSLIHESNVFKPDGVHVIAIGYPVLPWFGVMLLGYALGALYRSNVTAHDRCALLGRIGATAIAVFMVMRLINGYGDLHHWTSQSSEIRTIMSFLDCTKYPPSLLYTCMTIGPGLLILAAAERWTSPLSRMMITFGRVPFFYYLAHIYLIHALAWATAVVVGVAWSALDPSTSFGGMPIGFGFEIEWVYVFWISIIILLYPACRWYDRYKTSHKHITWLRYL